VLLRHPTQRQHGRLDEQGAYDGVRRRVGLVGPGDSSPWGTATP
jgi:hypothetical protein